ncbi:PREDICTED: uncharacterized protein LOC105559033 [Vollenhovia emeryi]|uniref:uncharacterized protein LOC105559033 n=1 Tax=Vollenhovia emeryi TaxID=411798 RepID=UPI0005F52FA3|nr:PREDICTED: uncharacterized protein LOC105559033 [Vollenhovia emeryi]
MSVEQLRRQRGTVKARLTVTQNFITRATETSDITTKEELEVRIQRLDEAYTRFQDIMQELVNIVPEEEYQERDAPEEEDLLIQRLSERSNDGNGDVLSQILEQQGQMLVQIRAQSNTPRESHVKLPIIKLPTFTGNIEEWKRYADTFKTLIHDSELSNVQKHQYLVGSLSG